MLEIFQYDFIIRALVAGVIVGLISPLIGTFIVLRRLSVIGDTLSHTTLAGVALGILIGVYPVLTGMLVAIVAAISIEQLRRVYKNYEELSMPIMMSAGVGLAIIFISLSSGFSVEISSYLFGNILVVSTQDIWTIIILAIVILTTILLMYKELLYISFDEEGAKISGIPYNLINFIFIILIAITIAIAMRIVGILLVSSLLTIPVATALNIANSFKQTIFYSVLFSLLSVIIGMLLAIIFNLASGGTIVITSIIIMLITLGVKKVFNK